MARILSHGFGAKVLAYDPQINESIDKDDKITYLSLPELLAQSDIVTLHSPLLPQTKHMINANTIAQMKDGAILINTSRGGLVDTKALVQALKSKKVSAVGLDVYEGESAYFFEDRSGSIIQDDVLARLLSFNNVFISGHQAFLTKEVGCKLPRTPVLEHAYGSSMQALAAIAQTTIENVDAIVNGKECPNVVNSN